MTGANLDFICSKIFFWVLAGCLLYCALVGDQRGSVLMLIMLGYHLTTVKKIRDRLEKIEIRKP